MEQPYLEYDPQPGPLTTRIERAALAFHQENPHVLREIVRVCLKVRAAGWQRWGIKAAFEVVRFSALETTGKTYKLNNNHAPIYARWIMRDVPELAGFFVTREVGRVPQEYDE